MNHNVYFVPGNSDSLKNDIFSSKCKDLGDDDDCYGGDENWWSK